MSHMLTHAISQTQKVVWPSPKSTGQEQRLYSAAGATSSHRAKARMKVKEQLGRTIYSTTALYHDHLCNWYIPILWA